MKNILVTGGAGFIGSHVVEKLLSDGYEIICLDNFDDYYDPEIKKGNIQFFLHKRNFTFIEEDIRDREKLEAVFEEFQFNKVIHLAARPGVRASLRDPSLYFEVNVNGTLNLLELSQKYQIQNFIFGSSSSVYGATTEIPFTEEGEVKPISPYGVSKRTGELLCFTFNHLYHLPVTIFRFFTVYGPRQRPDMAIYKFTKNIDEKKDISLYGNGRIKRDFTYISDIVDGIMLALSQTFDFQIFNLGNSETVSVSHIVSLIEKNLHKKAKINYLPEQPGDPSLTFSDINKSKKMLQYSPKVNIQEGIKKFIDWYKDEKS